MTPFKTLIILISILGSLSINAQKQNQIEFEEYQLDNGLTVLLHQDNSTPIAAVSVMYHVGSKNEQADRTGFAHFFEHLLFEGSENIDRGEFTHYVENAGGTLNANTTADRTFYYEILPSNQLELGMWLESERMLHAKVDLVGIETQREVVKEERRQRYDNQPYGTVLMETMKRAFTEHPYNWPVIGYMEHLNAATEEDYKTFYETFYVPNNAILSIAGDIDIKQTKEWIAAYFGPIPKGTLPIPRPTLTEPKQTTEIRDTIYDNIQLPAVIHGYKIPALGTPDYYALEMLGTLLSRGQSSRLYRSLVDDQQLAVNTGAFPMNLEDPGITIAYAITNMGVSPVEAEKAIIAEIEKVQNKLITEREYKKLRNQMENDLFSSFSTISGRASSLATYKMFYGDANIINTELERYLAVTKEDIQRVAQEYLTEENRVVLYYLPKE